VNHREIDWLLGRRFTTDFTVLAVDADAERTVTVLMRGEFYNISFDELMTIIERGFVTEAAPGGTS